MNRIIVFFFFFSEHFAERFKLQLSPDTKEAKNNVIPATRKLSLNEKNTPRVSYRIKKVIEMLFFPVDKFEFEILDTNPARFIIVSMIKTIIKRKRNMVLGSIICQFAFSGNFMLSPERNALHHSSP